jgi:quercetin dioxygenase-like cupin family protein
MGQARVIRAEDVFAQQSVGRQEAVRVLIDPDSGSERLLQQVITFPPGSSGSVGHAGADEAFYAAEGSGTLESLIREETHPLVPGVAALVPAKVPAQVINDGARGDLILVSVLSPPPFEGVFTMQALDLPLTVLHEGEQESLPAGDDRHFKLLVQSEHMTQFVGFIDKSNAPPHTHTYEEAIYVLEGDGLLHLDERTTPIGPGASVFLPPGTSHCLENQGLGVLKVLGVFSPPGSPADKVLQAD